MCSAINAGRPLSMLLIDIYIFVANYRNLKKLMLFRLIKYDICPYIARRDIYRIPVDSRDLYLIDTSTDPCF